MTSPSPASPAPPPRTFANIVQIRLIRFLLWLGRVVPEKAMSRGGDMLGLLWFHVVRFRRELAMDNLRQAYRGEKTETEMREIVRRNFMHYGRCLAEVLRFPSMTVESLRERIVAEGFEHVDEAKRRGKGIIVITGHFGNWDFFAVAQALLGMGGHIITRTARNQVVNDFWMGLRKEKGVKFLPDRNAIAGILRALKANEPVGMIFDQAIGAPLGVRVNFFGRPANTMRAAALLAGRTGCAILVAENWRGDDGKHHFTIHPEIPFERRDDEEETIRVNTQRYNDALEAIVRKRPEQWLWIHKRWKP